MRQEVNLYSAEFIPRKLWFSFTHGIIAGFLLISCLIVNSFYAYQKIIALKEENDSFSLIDSDIEGQSQSAGLMEKIVERKNILEAKISELSKDVEKKKRVKNIYEYNASLKSKSFYDVFSNISKHSDENISISEIGIHKKGEEIVINGLAKTKEKIPNYLRNLQTEKIFDGTNFGLLVINRTKKNDYYKFEMLSDFKDEKN